MMAFYLLAVLALVPLAALEELTWRSNSGFRAAVEGAYYTLYLLVAVMSYTALPFSPGDPDWFGQLIFIVGAVQLVDVLINKPVRG